MKKSLLIILLVISIISSYGQGLINGTFSNDHDTLRFDHDSVLFNIMSNGGLIFPIKGAGQYSINENILLVITGKNLLKPSFENSPRQLGDTAFSENETLIFKISSRTCDKMELVLLGICDNMDFKGARTVRKFEREHRNRFYRKRELIKD